MVRVQREDFDVNAELTRIAGQDAGACAAFVGRVRRETANGPLTVMRLEHYPGMTEKALAAIESEARGRWEILDATIIHRVGELKPGDNIVLVAVTSLHRREAFEACEYMVDFLKTRAPFWKKELTAAGARWVDARVADEQAAGRWT